ncbi:MAG: helix-hairpin-helix domain-containing protein, partial [Streptomyces sp.]|uniref:helix-hairpin-helix domain-containing protein n=1 Tax=Streptomyces sp. TaxID=1931 RepID=UPI003D6AB401
PEVGAPGPPASHPPARAGRTASGVAGPDPCSTSRERTTLALRERLPLWLQLRCGVELRSLLALAVVLLVAVGFGVHHFWTGRPETVRAPEAETSPAGSAVRAPGVGTHAAKGAGAQPPPGKRVVVDVAGKVRKPGIYRLPSGARVADALKSAGGLRPGTDISGLNRARRLVDGEQIVAGGAPAATAAATGGGPGPGSGGATGSGTPGGLVSLSSATAEQLETLPGVGPVLAQHILDYRDQHGGFTSIDQLQDVNGIGERRFADIKPKVSP